MPVSRPTTSETGSFHFLSLNTVGALNQHLRSPITRRPPYCEAAPNYQYAEAVWREGDGGRGEREREKEEEVWTLVVPRSIDEGGLVDNDGPLEIERWLRTQETWAEFPFTSRTRCWIALNIVEYRNDMTYRKCPPSLDLHITLYRITIPSYPYFANE